jgi:hypothetical protein
LVLWVLLAVIPSLGLILCSAQAQRRVATEAAHENLSRITRLATSEVQRMIEGADQLLSTVGASHEIRNGDLTNCGAVVAK